VDATSKALLEAQIKAEALFQEVVDAGLVSAGKLRMRPVIRATGSWKSTSSIARAKSAASTNSY
jgi:hypothetical protein